MRVTDIPLAKEIEKKLQSFNERRELLGISTSENRTCLVEQIIDSIRRVKYVLLIESKPLSDSSANPRLDSFNPIKAAVINKRQGNLDEAFWLIFLLTHFGKSKSTGWTLIKNVYGGVNHADLWTWNDICADLEGFQYWLNDNVVELKNSGVFGNHRKYESLSAFKSNGTGAAVRSYVDWVMKFGNHSELFDSKRPTANASPREWFSALFESMDCVVRFGRTARFDYLTMVGKLKLINIEPDSTYMNGATGPLTGARLLFGGNKNSPMKYEELNSLLYELEAHIGLSFGMQILEDALCNWQKSPNKYVYFAG